jgi:hypothetical protein
VHLFEPGITTHSPGFNPLALPHDCLAPGVTNIVEAFAQVWGEDTNATPLIKTVLSATLYLLAEHGLTIAEARAILSLEHKARRNELGRALTNSYFRQEWADFEEKADKDWPEFVESTRRRLGPFLSSPIVRRMLGRREHVLDLAGAMERGDIVLVNLRVTDQFTEEDQRIIGSLLVNELRLSALRRRNPTPRFYAVIDECYKFLNQDVESMLVETRKRGVHLLLAHQNLAQLGPQDGAIYQSVMAIPNKIVFGSVTADNARTLAEEIFCGEFDLEMQKSKHRTPVVVGHRLRWLESTARGRTRSTSECDGEGETDGEGRSMPEMPLEAGEENRVRIATTNSRTRNSQRTTAESENETIGSAQTLQPILEDRATQLYSLEEQKYRAAARIKGQVTGVAIVKALGNQSTQVEMTMPKPGLPRSGKLFTAWKKRVLESSPHILSSAEVDRLIDARGVEHRLGTVASERPLQTREPVYGRRVARTRGRGDA